MRQMRVWNAASRFKSQRLPMFDSERSRARTPSVKKRRRIPAPTPKAGPPAEVVWSARLLALKDFMSTKEPPSSALSQTHSRPRPLSWLSSEAAGSGGVLGRADDEVEVG